MYNEYLIISKLYLSSFELWESSQNILNSDNTENGRSLSRQNSLNILFKDGRPKILFSIHFVRILFLTHNLISYCFVFNKSQGKIEMLIVWFSISLREQ